MPDDSRIRIDVEEELCWDPEVEHEGISVAVKNGVVTLTGVASDLRRKNQAECAAMRVQGVHGIVNDIDVRLSAEQVKVDSRIAGDAIAVLAEDQPELSDLIQIIVRDGHVWLRGVVDSQWRRQRAESAVRGVGGVTMISNHIAIRPAMPVGEVVSRIEAALQRNATVDARQIQVHAENGKIVLRGTVRSLPEKHEAQRTAWRAPGVHDVIDEIMVRAESRQVPPP